MGTFSIQPEKGVKERVPESGRTAPEGNARGEDAVGSGERARAVDLVVAHRVLSDRAPSRERVGALAGLVREVGGLPHKVAIARDDLSALGSIIASSLGYDVVITTGGVSVGDRDHVRAALALSGVTLELWKVAMKPGKPFSFGTRPGPDGRPGTPVFGLPGNPISTIVAFELFLRPALLAMQGATTIDRPRAPVQLVRGYRKQAGRAHFVRARVVRNGEHLIAHPHPKQGSAMLSSLLGSNALVELPAEQVEVRPGAIVQAILFEAV